VCFQRRRLVSRYRVKIDIDCIINGELSGVWDVVGCGGVNCGFTIALPLVTSLEDSDALRLSPHHH